MTRLRLVGTSIAGMVQTGCGSKAALVDKRALRGGNNMVFRKATVVLSLLMVCFVLAAQSARAENIFFTDNVGDSPTLTGSSRFLAPPTCGVDICTATLLGPGTAIILNTGTISFFLGEGSTTGNISDDFIGTVGSVAVVLKFDSDLPTVGPTGGETTNLGPCVIPVRPLGCNAAENGLPQSFSSVTWSDGTVDNFFIQSEVGAVAVVPESGSLILLGSGLVIAGGLLRRRRGLVMTPSV